MSYQNIIAETKGRVGIIRFNRPAALNALNAALVEELNAAIEAFEADANIGCLLITGSEKAFAALANETMASAAIPIMVLRMELSPSEIPQQSPYNGAAGDGSG